MLPNIDADTFGIIIGAVIIICLAYIFIAPYFRRRALSRLADEQNWEKFRQKPLNDGLERAEKGFRGKYRGYAITAVEYHTKTIEPGSGGDGPQDRTSIRSVIQVKVDKELPDCVIELTRGRASLPDMLTPEGVLQPKFEEWFRRNGYRCPAFKAAKGKLSIHTKGSLNKKNLLRGLDFLIDVAEQLPIHTAKQ